MERLGQRITVQGLIRSRDMHGAQHEIPEKLKELLKELEQTLSQGYEGGSRSQRRGQVRGRRDVAVVGRNSGGGPAGSGLGKI